MTGQPQIGIIGFSHVCIAVSDMAASLPFYRDLLGLDVFFDVGELEGSAVTSLTAEAASFFYAAVAAGRASPALSMLRAACSSAGA